jgi:hypothetical protein
MELNDPYEVEATYDRDSKRYYKYDVIDRVNEAVVGSIYITKDSIKVPEQVIIHIGRE